MNNKGNFTAIIGLILLVLLGNTFIQVQSIQQADKNRNLIDSLNELQALVQRINWVVDKRISDDLADYAFSRGCAMDSGFSANILSDLTTIFVPGIEKPTGVSCSLVNFTSSYSGSNPYDVTSNYSISCSATASNGSISFSQAFSSKKRINPVSVIGSCTITVTDITSSVVEVQQTQTTT
jgi:hypothetical protein